tara:strand:+ start:13266 stop:13523 length:258 start_codon:yes stop_codon:yes gene_type:complete
MHTEKTKLFEETYAALSDCHIEIKFSEELTDFEIDRARKLLNFCGVMQGQFKDDERFSDLFSPRDKGTRRISEIIEELSKERIVK